MSENTEPIQLTRPTYYELFTKILNELSWRETQDFESIEKAEHKRILNLINATNSEVLSSYIWDFQIQNENITLEANARTILDNFNGRIISVNEGCKKYRYVHPTRIASEADNRCDIYSNTGDCIITNPAKHKRILSLTYVSNNFALNKDGAKISHMIAKDDTSIIPVPFAEPILVYGTLLKVKANPSFAKFGYWRSMYYSSISALRSSGTLSVEDSPRISLN